MSDSFSVVLRRDYLELIESMAAGIEGKVVRCAATLIAYYRHWQEWKQKHQRTDWVYQPLRQLYKDLMGLFSIPVIRAANDLLIDLDLLERRGNPGNGQDKTYQYNVQFDRVRQLLATTCAGASFEKINLSVANPNFSASPANTHHNIQFSNVTSSNHDAIEKNKIENNQKSITSTTQVEVLTATKEQGEVHQLVAESLNVGQHSDTSLDGDEKIELAQQYLASLNAKAELAERCRNHDAASFRPIRIPGLDEAVHEVLWKHQELLEQLNVDLHAERIHKAIADNPQYLEDAILTLSENSANGAKTKEAATGFLYNALLKGWKPRQSSSTSASVQAYTPPPQMLEDPLPPTLEQLVERKRLMWRNAPVLRSSIEAWVKQTPGVMMTADGPALESATNQPAPVDPELEVATPQVSLAATDINLPEDEATPPLLEPLTPAEVEPSQELLSQPSPAAVKSATLVASAQTPPPPETTTPVAVELPTQSSLSTPTTADPKPPSNRRLQPVEILTSAGKWIAGYFVHSCIAVANLVEQERQFTLFDASGETYTFLGQIRPL